LTPSTRVGPQGDRQAPRCTTMAPTTGRASPLGQQTLVCPDRQRCHSRSRAGRQPPPRPGGNRRTLRTHPQADRKTALLGVAALTPLWHGVGSSLPLPSRLRRGHCRYAPARRLARQRGPGRTQWSWTSPARTTTPRPETPLAQLATCELRPPGAPPCDASPEPPNGGSRPPPPTKGGQRVPKQLVGSQLAPPRHRAPRGTALPRPRRYILSLRGAVAPQQPAPAAGLPPRRMLAATPRIHHAPRVRCRGTRSPSEASAAGPPLPLLLVLPRLVPRPVAAAVLLPPMGRTRRLLPPLLRPRPRAPR
jgi:hypothetical protein